VRLENGIETLAAFPLVLVDSGREAEAFLPHFSPRNSHDGRCAARMTRDNATAVTRRWNLDLETKESTGVTAVRVEQLRPSNIGEREIFKKLERTDREWNVRARLTSVAVVCSRRSKRVEMSLSTGWMERCLGIITRTSWSNELRPERVEFVVRG